MQHCVCRVAPCHPPQDPHKYRGKRKTKSNKAGRVGPKAWSKEVKDKEKQQQQQQG